MAGKTGQKEHEATTSPPRILVCLDGSGAAEEVLPHVRKQARALGGRVTLLEVVGTSERGGSAWGRALVWKRQVDRGALEYLDHVANSLRRRGVAAEPDVVSARGASAGETILGYADKHKVDLIALTTHGQSGLAHISAGSVCGYLMRHCRVPLLVLKLR